MHPEVYVAGIDRFCEAGGGHLDADTVLSSESAAIARLAAGSGLDAIGRLERGEADAAFMAVRPPGAPRDRDPCHGLLRVQQRRGRRGSAGSLG